MNISGFWRNYRSAAVLAVLALGVSTQTQAGYIASNLGTGGSFNALSGYNLSGPGVAGGNGYSLGVEFTVAGSSNVVFGSAELALQYHSGLNSVSVMLMTSAGGLPGTALTTMTLSGLSSTPTLVTAMATSNVTLMAGSTYWLVAVATSNSFFTWMLNNTGQTGHFADEQVKSSGPLGWVAAPTDTDVAFQVNPVPSPRSGPLLGFGLIGFGLSAFRSRRIRRLVQPTV